MNVIDITGVTIVHDVALQMEADITSENVKRDEYGFEVFGEETERAESIESCHQEEAKEEIKYDEYGCGLLFDFA